MKKEVLDYIKDINEAMEDIPKLKPLFEEMLKDFEE